MAHLSMGGSPPLPLYSITGSTAAIPSGSTSRATYSNMAALLAAVPPRWQGDTIQIAGAPELWAVGLYVGRWDGVDSWTWEPAL